MRLEKIINDSKPAVKALQKAKAAWLKAETGQWYVTRDNVSQYLKVIHCLLAQKLHPIEFDTLDQDVRYKVSEIIQLKFEKQAYKLKKLIEEKNKTLLEKSQLIINKETPILFFDRVVNLTNVTLEKDEQNLLSKGLKYCPPLPNRKSDYENLAIDLEIALHKNLTSKHICSRILKKDCLSSVKNRSKFNDELVTLKNIKDKIKENNIIVTKADKGSTTVLLTSNDYW